jgi:alanine racemase
MIRPTVARVDLGAIRSNFRAIAEFLDRRAGIIAVVKANAYGHGAPQVARALEDAGAAMLAVADIEEGHISTATCILANVAMETGRPVVYDSKKRAVIGDREATKLLRRPYRAPWKHPGA